ncbi:MAG TPA: metal ABC transporter permease, partial [Solirubrobacteraceae bacterium]
MFSQEFMRNALLAGTSVALACGVCGWFVVLRGQVFAGDALSHVAFPGALAAAAAGIDERVGLFAATVAVALGMGLLGRGALAAAGGRRTGSLPVDDTAIGVLFTFILGLGLFFLTRFSMGSGGSAGVQAAHTLFGSIFGLAAGEARLAAVVGLAVVLAMALIARPLLFASVAPDVAGARGVPTRMLGVAF